MGRELCSESRTIYETSVKVKPAAILLAVLVVMCAWLFAACGDKYEGSAYTGKWKCVSANMQGIKISADKVVKDFSITLDLNGKAAAVIDGKESGGEWEKTEHGFKIKSGDKELEFQKIDDEVIYQDQGVEILFEKEK